MSRWGGWAPYIPVGQRRAQASREMEGLRKKGQQIEPVRVAGRAIAGTFWGQAWCRHLEQFSDYANRLPRGRTYVRNGSVCHLAVSEGSVEAVVSGSMLYDVKVRIQKLPLKKWTELKGRCTRGIGSLLELLQGRVSESVMQVVTNRDQGLFPHPREIDLDCSCPDYADMCKHVAAVLYGVGARLDEKPELLFQLRGVNPEELVAEGAVSDVVAGKRSRRIAEGDLSEVFGIELAGRKPQALPSGPTGEAVAALRASFAMSQGEFARLLRVSLSSVAGWERKRGPLKLQARSLRVWESLSRLDKKAAWKRLRGAYRDH